MSRDYLASFIKPMFTQAVGKSMHPIICDGDLVLVDQNPERRLQPNGKGIYLVNTSDAFEEVAIAMKWVDLADC
jgi:hypothetical protein